MGARAAAALPIRRRQAHVHGARGLPDRPASVPRLPLVFLLAGDCAREAAVVHDFLYSTHEVDRATADAVLREASACTGVAAWRRWLMWAGVRLGGARHWDPEAAVAPVPSAPDT